MSNATTPAEIMSLLSQILPDAFGKKVAQCRRVALIVELTARAADCGMTDARDIAVYCAISISIGRQFFERPAWIATAARVSRGELTWSHALNSDELWEECR